MKQQRSPVLKVHYQKWIWNKKYSWIPILRNLTINCHASFDKFIRCDWSGPDSFSMDRSRAHISVVDITGRLQRKIWRTCMTEPIASTVSAWRKAERVFRVIFSRWLCSSMIAWWKRSETCSRRKQTCRMLIRTSPDRCVDKMPTGQNARPAVTIDKGCGGGGRGSTRWPNGLLAF